MNVILCLLLAVPAAIAQSVLPCGETKTIQMHDFAYQCDNNGHGIVTLYNVQGKFTRVDKAYRDGREYVEEDFFSGARGPGEVEENFWVYTKPKMDSLVNDAFGPWKLLIGDDEFVITLIIDAETGDVSEVIYEFSDKSQYIKMAVFAYRELELSIKENLRFTLTDHGKQLNYAMLTWVYGIKGEGRNKRGDADL
ncbi:MAG: DUF5043 domain-containing protein [Odoribacteraceae bacterium]|nr:DUF5043 domain-containing protein [Odoribacteraceae bacterium]